MLRRMIWGALAIAVTLWQLQAGFARCGTVDGGILLVPLVVLAVLLVRGVTEDLREVFAPENQRRVTNG